MIEIGRRERRSSSRRASTRSNQPRAPESAVSVQGDSAFVYVVTPQGQRMTADQRPVVTGARQDGFVELKDGVAAGDRIVADGLNKMQPGQPVRVVDHNGAPGAHAGAAMGAGGARPGA